MKRLLCSIAACVLTASASISYASGYIGASIGSTDVNTDISNFDDGSSIAIYGGYRINKNFAVEGAFIDLGESEDNIDPVWTAEVDGLNFAAVGIFPASEKIDLFAKLGIYMWDLSVSEAGFGKFHSSDGTDISFGFGAAINLTRQFGLVVEYQKFEVDDADIPDDISLSNISFGARFNF